MVANSIGPVVDQLTCKHDCSKKCNELQEITNNFMQTIKIDEEKILNNWSSKE